MRESQQKDVTLRINKSEDASLTELLNFMYNKTLSATTTPDLLGVLTVADKFEVTSCIRYCTSLLLKRPMSLESALLYLELPPGVLSSESAQSLIDAAKTWLVDHFKDINKSEEEAMTLPLFAVEVVLGSDSLHADSRDDIFEFILKWARANYPEIELRREILTKRLTKYIPFPYMSCSKLRQVLICPDFDYEQVSKLVIEAIFFKVELPYVQYIHASDKRQLIKAEQFELSEPRCVVYFDLKKEDCNSLFPSGHLMSPSFRLGGRWFYLMADCFTDDKQQKTFALFLCKTKESESCTVDFEFAVVKESSKEFQNKFKCSHSDFSVGWGLRDLFRMPWIELLSKDEYFINGILHLRADLTIKNSKA